MTSTCTFIVQATDAGGWSQVKLPIVSDYVAPASTKLPLRAPGDSVAAPGFSGEGESCRTVIVRTDGPVPAKVCWKSGFVVHCCQPIIAKPTLWPVTQADYQQASNSTAVTSPCVWLLLSPPAQCIATCLQQRTSCQH